MYKKVSLFGTVVLVLLASKSISSAYEMLQTTNFESGISLPWNLVESEERNARSEVEDGNYVVRIDYPGENNWDVQVRHREISLRKGAEYVVKFKVTAEKSCKIYAKIGDQGAPYWEAWNNKWSTFQIEANQILEVSERFIAEKDSSEAEFAFHIGGRNAQSLPNKVKFISMSLEDCNGIPTPTEQVKKIMVNQLGYLPDSSKKATLILKDECYSTPIKWELRNEAGVAVHKGETTPFGLDEASGDYVHTIDFSDFSTEGKGYSLVTEFGDISYGFDISKSIYSQMKYDALKYFYHARSGIEIELPYCVKRKWERGAGHDPDIVTLNPKFTFEGPSQIDSTGGWYDGADYGKYVVHGGLALWLLQNLYERSEITKENYYLKDGRLNIPESGNTINDLLDETRWEMDWMLNMQIPSGYENEGMAVHNVADEKWIAIGTSPCDNNMKRIYYKPTTAATLNLAACGAQAARIWKGVDVKYSERCLSAAEKAYTAAKANPDIFASHDFFGAGDSVVMKYWDDNVKDDFYWAACELYLTTGKSEYLKDLKAYDEFAMIPNSLKVNFFDSLYNFDGGFDCLATTALGTISLAMLKPDEFPEALDNIKKAADGYLEVQRKQGYGVPISVLKYLTYTSCSRDRQVEDIAYTECSNQYVVSKSIILAYAYDLSNDTKYFKGITESIDYLMGRNPNNKSYVSGYGEKPLQNPFHKFFCHQYNKEFPSVPPGFLASGPNSDDGEVWAGGWHRKDPPQKNYKDDVESWTNNEVNINLNATLAWITSYIDGMNPESFMEEDLDQDGFITMSDVMKIAKCFNSKVGDENYNEKYDINKDGDINMIDVVRIAKVFGYNKP